MRPKNAGAKGMSMLSRIAWGAAVLLAANMAWLVLANAGLAMVVDASGTYLTGKVDSLMVFLDFVLPVTVSILVFQRLDLFRFHTSALRGAAMLTVCILAPLVSFALFYALAMPGCWHRWLTGMQCSY